MHPHPRPARRRALLTALVAATGLGVAASPAAALDLKVDFKPASAATASGYVADTGQPYAAARGYGFVREDSLGGSPIGLDITSRTRDRAVTGVDQRSKTLAQLILAGQPTAAWEAAVPNGQYTVTVSAGDPSYTDSRHVVNVEGSRALDFTPTTSVKSKTGTATVSVTDGRLTIDGKGGTNVKLQYVDIASVAAPPAGNVLYRIDAGSPSPTTDSSGNVWAADTGRFSPAHAAAEGAKTDAINGTVDDAIFATNRGNVGSSTPLASRALSYALPTTATSVDVKLLFAERYWTSAGKRRFDIFAEDVKRISNFDIWAAAGAKDTAVTRTISGVTVTGGVLNLRLQTLADMPLLSGIEVTCTAGCGGEPPVDPTDPTDPTEPSTPPGNGGITVTALDPGGATTDRLMFSRIDQPMVDASTYNPDNPPDLWGNPDSHTVSKARITNTGTGPVQITGLPITAGAQYYRLLPPAPSLPLTLAQGASTEISVEFIAPKERWVRTGTLTVQSNSSTSPSVAVPLGGYIQEIPEDNREPTIQQVVNGVFGYDVNFGTTSPTDRATLYQKGAVIARGSEVISPLWERASTSQPVKAVQLGAYHGVGPETLKWYNDGSFSTTNLVKHRYADNQTVLPRLDANTNTAQGTFTPAAKFGFRVGVDWSDPTRNTTGIELDQSKGCPTSGVQCGHRLRFWPVRLPGGAIVPNAYILGQDYTSPYINYDYNDNIYLVTNIKPVGAPTPPPSGPVITRIDTGSTTATTDAAGNTWQPDTGLFAPNVAVEGNNADAIEGTTDDGIYRTYRSAATLTYEIPITGSATAVDIRVLMAERYWTTSNKRVFDIYANGVKRADAVDLYARARKNTANDEIIDNVAIGADRKLTLRFQASIDKGAVSGIEVRCRTTC